MKTALLALALLSLPMAAAGAEPPYGAQAATPDASLPEGACIRISDIVERTLAADGRTFYLKVSSRGVYRATAAQPCVKGGGGIAIIFRRPPGYSRACKPSELLMTVKQGSRTRNCPIVSLELLHPEAVQALPKGLRP